MTEDSENAQVQNEPVDKHAIREIRTYVDNKGRNVREFIQVYGKGKEPNFYKGSAVVQVQMQHPQGIPMPPQMRPFEFDIPASGVRGAFEAFDRAAQTELQEMQKRQKEQSRIVAARSVPTLMGANGKPLPKG